METWQDVLRKNSISSLEELAAKFGPEHFPELDRLRQAAENFEFRISPAMVDLIKSPDDPIWRQYVPSVEELDVVDGIVDSLNEDGDSPVPNITHRYPDRALFLVSPVCATYCRFCTRRRKVGDPEKIPMSQFESAFQYLEQHTEIRDVIMSGGDPLLLNDRRLEAILTRLRAIPHLQIIRIGSRIPCHLPERVTPELCATLKRFHPLFYWACVVATTTVGTTTSDYFDRTLGLGYIKSSAILLAGVIVVLATWRRTTGSIAVDRITSRTNETFYWVTILVSNTLGTALGDFTADDLGAGFEGGALIFAGLLAVVAALHVFTRAPKAILFWAAYVLTRPLGATLGDLLTKPVEHGGLNLSRIGASAAIAALMIVAVWLTERRQARMQPAQAG
jgi:uncharacterized membrane-anchored protein